MMSKGRFTGLSLWVAVAMAGLVGASCSASKTTSQGGSGPTTGSGDAVGASGSGGSTGNLSVGTGSGAGGMTNGSGSGPTSGSGGGDAPADACTVCAEAGGACTNGVCVIVDDIGKLDPTTKDALDGGGSADSGFRFVYPYDKTVFARGLLPPTLQLEGAKADALLVTIQSANYDYTGWFGSSSPIRVPLPAKAWEAMTLAAGAKDPVKVSVTKITGGQVTGPVSETWTIAQGSLKGTIYYETYDSPLAGGPLSVGIMRLDPGELQPTVLKKGCGNTCHTASADGSTLVSATGFLTNSISYDLKQGAATMKVQPDASFTYGGLYPNGKFLMSSTHHRAWIGLPSRLYDTKTGTQLPAPTWNNVITNGGTPSFAPDGKAIVFNHEDTGQGHTIATMAFEAQGLVFSNLQDVATDPNRFLGWPAFTPDGKRVIYQAGTKENFETNDGAKGDLYMVNPSTKKMQRLDALDGYSGNGSYLPANDPDLSFAPTVLPLAVGGYFWVIFTSHRSYGNTLPSLDNNGTNGKLWVSAIDIDPSDGIDPSHPAFYLEGQELTANNLRGFWVLAPCKDVGQGCKTGDECCGGYCYEVDGKVQCQPKPDGCSNEFEKCLTAADCCEPGAECINGFCAIPAPK